MILKTLCLFSQNVYKNRTLTDIIIENNKEFDILFIQEPSWLFIQTVPSLTSEEGDKVVDAPNYLDLLTFSRQSSNINDYPKVLMYINV